MLLTPGSGAWSFLGWLFGEASLRVEGVGAEGLALQFLGFALLLLLLLLDAGGRGCLFRACALLVQSKKVCVGETLCSAQAVMSQVLVVLFLVLFWLSCF